MPISNVELKNRMYYVYDEKQKEIAHNWENSLGEFRNVAGKTITFVRNKMMYVYDEKLKELSHKWL